MNFALHPGFIGFSAFLFLINSGNYFYSGFFTVLSPTNTLKNLGYRGRRASIICFPTYPRPVEENLGLFSYAAAFSSSIPFSF